MNENNSAAEPALIPREILFGNPSRATPRISPDGRRMAYLAPSAEGVLNIWLAVQEGEDIQLTADTTRGIRSFAWAETSEQIIFQQDRGGDENWHFYLVHVENQLVRDLTAFEGVRAQSLLTDRDHPGQILVGLNLRDRGLFDMHRIDLATGAVVLDTENPGDVLGWLTDAEFRIRGAVAQDPEDGGTILRVRDSEEDPWRQLLVWPFGENGGPVSFDKQGRLYCLTSIGSDTTRLVLIDTQSGEILEEIAHDPRCDVGPMLFHQETRNVQAVCFDYQREKWTLFDPTLEKDFARLGKIAPGDISIPCRDRDDRQWIVAFARDTGPMAWYRYNRESAEAELIFLSRPELEDLPLAPMEPVTITARDGLEMVAYLTRPLNRPDGRVPLVLNVHGGPWARDCWGFTPEAQWLANRGYATLQVNFRGSTGFGKSFINAGNKQWGVGAMQHDLSDAVAWAVEEGIADPERICIYGGSYGGYATLAGLCFTPDLYACGVDIVGPSNLRTLFESIPPYWAPMMKELMLRVGDAQGDEEFNKRISPLYHVEKIRSPLIIAQGANDPRVKITEAEQMVSAMRDGGLQVQYVLYPDEGHGFARPENRLDFYGRIEEFLAEHLGGRAEPWQEVEGATAELH